MAFCRIVGVQVEGSSLIEGFVVLAKVFTVFFFRV